MKQWVYGILLLGAFGGAAGCSDDDDRCREPENGLATIYFRATESDSPFTGAVEIYPCEPGTFTYFGNYVNGQLGPIPPLYIVGNGSITNALTPLYLPIGNYRLIYWGVTNESSFAYPAVNSPALTVGGDLSGQFFSLRPQSQPGDTTYLPGFDFVFAVKDVHVGGQSIAVPLQRVVAGLDVVLKNNNNAKFDASIDTIEVYVGGIYERINATTAAPSGSLKTVKFPLAMAADSLSASNKTVPLFPSSANPPFAIRIGLKNGEVKTFKTTLASAFAANTKQTITVTADLIFSEVTEGSGFTVSNWVEENTSLSGAFE